MTAATASKKEFQIWKKFASHTQFPHTNIIPRNKSPAKDPTNQCIQASFKLVIATITEAIKTMKN